MSTTQMKASNPVSRAERNLGVDALRVVSMLLIVMLHVLNRGGAFGAAGDLTTTRGVVLVPVRALCMAGVDIFAIISGYVLINGHFRPARLLELWLEVVFLGVLCCLLEIYVFHFPVTPKLWLKAFMPITHRENWYFAAYGGLFWLVPIINRGIQAMERRQLLILMKLLFVVFCLGTAVSIMSGHDCFRMFSGYSTLWLVVLYIFGACIKRTGYLHDTAACKLWLTVVLCLAACLGINALLSSPKIPESLVKSEWLTMNKWRGLVFNFLNPLLVVVSVRLLVLFSRLRPGKILSALIRLLSPLTLGVFVIHVHNLGWTLLKEKFIWVGNVRALLIVPALLGVSLGIFLACAVVDWIRAQLFRLLRVRKLCDKTEAAIRRICLKLVKE